MDFLHALEKLMSMDDATWARHANPLSVYTRIIGGTALFFALWSPFWIGWWGVPLILAACAWTWLNPRLFPPPKQTKTWATQGVLGERAYLNRKTTPVPAHHHRMATLTSCLSGLFLLLFVLAAFRQDFLLAVTAWHAATLAKIWFVDRMVWLWSDMKTATPRYQNWDAANWD